MIRIAILYPRENEKTFNVEYYVSTHMALVHEKLASRGLKGLQVDKGLAGVARGESPFFAISYLVFENLEDFFAAFEEVGEELLSDIPNYTDVEPLIQISEVLEF